MRRLRVLLLLAWLAGLEALATGAPVLARVPGPDSGAATTSSQRALQLLDNAARVARNLPWSGVQQVTSWQSGVARTAVLSVSYDPGVGSVVRDASDPTTALAVPADVLDERLVGLLGSRYDLSVTTTGRCAGHLADLVEARRRGVSGAAAVAGRFWVDRTTGMVLRRDVLDPSGAVVRRTAFVHLDSTAAPVVVAAAPALRPTGRRVTAVELAGLRTAAPTELPDGMRLFEARMHDRVLQLAYSDGLSSLSLFVQPGDVPPSVEGAVQRRGGYDVVSVAPGREQLVWAGGGRTWTLVSDAPADAVNAAVAALPHGAGKRPADGLPARSWRGLSRVGSWLNPFD